MAVDLAPLAKNTLVHELEHLHKELHELVKELTEEEFWTRPLEPANSFGHLVLHLTGNLNHFVGAQLGGTGYVRDRDREFADASPPPKPAALAGLDAAVATFHQVVDRLDAE